MLTACAPTYSSPEDHSKGFWTTVTADTYQGEVWCNIGSSFSNDTFDCDWATLHDSIDHEGNAKANGSFRYLEGSDHKVHRLLCLTYDTKGGYESRNCNWASLHA